MLGDINSHSIPSQTTPGAQNSRIRADSNRIPLCSDGLAHLSSTTNQPEDWDSRFDVTSTSFPTRGPAPQAKFVGADPSWRCESSDLPGIFARSIDKKLKSIPLVNSLPRNPTTKNGCWTITRFSQEPSRNTSAPTDYKTRKKRLQSQI